MGDRLDTEDAALDRSIAARHARQDCGCGPCGRHPEAKVPPAVVLDYQRFWPTGRPPAETNGKETDMAKKNGVPTGKAGKVETSDPFERDLECKLKPAELQAKKDRALEALNEADEKKAELDKLSLPLRNSIKALKKEANKLRAEAKKGTEVRKVKCVTRKNLSTNRFQMIRQDTREVIEDRTLTREEAQAAMEYPPVPARGKPNLRSVAEVDPDDEVEEAPAE